MSGLAGGRHPGYDKAMAFPNIPSSMNRASQHYQGEAGRSYHEAKRAIPDAARPWVAESRAGKIAPHVRAQDVVLEYGVGFGWNLAALKCRRRIGHDVAECLAPAVQALGIEFAPDPRALPDGLADVVISHHTLEHALSPSEMLAEIRRLLRPGGTLLLFVPLERERRYWRFNPDEPNHHLYSWNVQTLGNLVLESGFELRTAGIGRFGYDRFAAIRSCRWRLGRPGYRFIRSLALRLVPAWEVRIVASRPSA
jgi:SAM-dependent methyltransferase